jgi:hypothetical protein
VCAVLQPGRDADRHLLVRLRRAAAAAARLSAALLAGRRIRCPPGGRCQSRGIWQRRNAGAGRGLVESSRAFRLIASRTAPGCNPARRAASRSATRSARSAPPIGPSLAGCSPSARQRLAGWLRGLDNDGHAILDKHPMDASLMLIIFWTRDAASRWHSRRKQLRNGMPPARFERTAPGLGIARRSCCEVTSGAMSASFLSSAPRHVISGHVNSDQVGSKLVASAA